MNPLRALVVAIALGGAGCGWILAHDPPTCPYGHPNCGCTDEQRATGCPTTPTNLDDPVNYPTMGTSASASVDAGVGG